MDAPHFPQALFVPLIFHIRPGGSPELSLDPVEEDIVGL